MSNQWIAMVEPPVLSDCSGPTTRWTPDASVGERSLASWTTSSTRCSSSPGDGLTRYPAAVAARRSSSWRSATRAPTQRTSPGSRCGSPPTRRGSLSPPDLQKLHPRARLSSW